MIKGKDTNTVYFSELLKTDERYKQTFNVLEGILNRNQIPIKFLKTTQDIWCRDYMPVQKGEGEFIQFRYEPSYLKDYPELRSDPVEVCKKNNIPVKLSQINLDGGNIVNWSDRAIITDRIFDENPSYDKIKLIKDLQKLLKVEVIIIPQINSDMTGHADGLIRFVDRNTVIGNDRAKEFKYWREGINKVLKAHNIDYIDIPFFHHYKNRKYPHHAIGCYINYLEVKDLIVLPIFEIPGNHDKEVVDLFKNIFPERKIETINYNAIALHGGLLNCTTWTIENGSLILKP